MQRPVPEAAPVLRDGQEVDEPGPRAVRSVVRRASGQLRRHLHQGARTRRLRPEERQKGAERQSGQRPKRHSEFVRWKLFPVSGILRNFISERIRRKIVSERLDRKFVSERLYRTNRPGRWIPWQNFRFRRNQFRFSGFYRRRRRIEDERLAGIVSFVIVLLLNFSFLPALLRLVFLPLIPVQSGFQ